MKERDVVCSLRNGHVLFFSNGTYHCSHWPPDEYSLWKIEDNQLFFRHRSDDEFNLWKDPRNKHVVAEIQEYWTAMIEKELLT